MASKVIKIQLLICSFAEWEVRDQQFKMILGVSSTILWLYPQNGHVGLY